MSAATGNTCKERRKKRSFIIRVANNDCHHGIVGALRSSSWPSRLPDWRRAMLKLNLLCPLIQQ